MTALAEKIYNEVLDLPAEERLSLMDRLLHVGNIQTDEAVDKVWCEEVARRDQQIEAGTATLIPGERVLERLRKRFPE